MTLAITGCRRILYLIIAGRDDMSDAMETIRPRSALQKRRNVMKGLSLNTDMTMVVVTHGMGFAREVTGRVIFMNHSMMARETIFTNPANERIRSFLKQAIKEGGIGNQYHYASRPMRSIKYIPYNSIDDAQRCSDSSTYRSGRAAGIGYLKREALYEGRSLMIS